MPYTKSLALKEIAAASVMAALTLLMVTVLLAKSYATLALH